MRVLDDVVRAGKLLYMGISNAPASVLRKLAIQSNYCN
jgi:aryl-alcohol dehydrogenase-like predicted oxidoreductase